jgi:glutamate-ammonia-ligase adenylyltransferase
VTTPPQANIEALVRDLPDAEGARLFWARLEQEQPRAARKLLRPESAGLLADALALAAWSPLLATTLTQHPHYFSWLERERAVTRVKTSEELGESLGRFASTNSQLEPQVLLARFRRRELLRIYLRDLRRTATLVETTEELSNLADAVLAYSLNLARNDLDNKYGPPLQVDERGRAAPAAFCVVALGKLGSLELNYSSDIDLLFLYSADGGTSGAGARGAATNREYFCKLAEAIAQLAGKPTGEGAAYRVDLRLRPYGRDGALASSLAEAARYYQTKSQAWELQTLIRARAAAGDAALYHEFAAQLRPFVYAPDKSVAHALADVKLAKQKIDRQHPPKNGYNVKLGKGGVREIEFIAQALQLAHGGRDEWLRAPHTLISLGRLADRQLITERELSELSDSYAFLRTLEHRLQMEHGLQTHLLPDETARRELAARRLDFAALEDFNAALATHTENVSRAFARIFGAEVPANISLPAVAPETAPPAPKHLEHPNPETTRSNAAAAILAPRLGLSEAKTAAQISLAAESSLNPRRALSLLARIAASLDKGADDAPLDGERLGALIKLCGASESFGALLAGNPSLINALPLSHEPVPAPAYQALLRDAVTNAPDFGAALAQLRRAWSPLFLAIGAHDAAGRITRQEATQRQTALAEASLNAALIIAQQELTRRFSLPLSPSPLLPLAVLGLGRLGSGGMDYGSDLDLVLVYDEDAPAPVAALTHAEGYRRLAELFVTALSSLTRDGFLYRVDLRLRPDGRNGPTVSPARSFLSYLQNRAAVWEWLAYVKLRNAECGTSVKWGDELAQEARRIIHEAAQSVPPEQLRDETRRVRQRLEAEKTKGRAAREIDIKHGAGGLLDVYFAVRYLQLRDNAPDAGAERSTAATLTKLRAAGSLNTEQYAALSEGYEFLRALDHRLRLVAGRSSRLPAAEHSVLQDVARSLGYDSADALLRELNRHAVALRAVFNEVTSC